MTKTRRVGGNATYIVRGTTREFANEIEINSNGRIDYYAPEYTYGDPEPRPVRKEPEVAFSGCWTSDYEGMRNLEKDTTKPMSNLGETVYFQLTVSNDIPIGTNITFKLWDEDFGDILNWFLSDDDTFDGKKVYRNAVVREVNGTHKMTIKLFLNPKWYDDLVADLGRFKNGCLDFYWTWEYNGKPWTSNTNILNVYPSKTTLFIKPAYEGYGFPELRTADGQLIVFSAGIVATKEPSKELENIMDTILDDIKNNAIADVREKVVKFSDKLRYSIAIKKLKKGYLANNLGKIEFSRRLYTKPVFDNSGKLYEITQAANFGYIKEGKLVTTKGISQLDYFREIGVRNAILKNAEKLDYILQALDLLRFAMDEKKIETITTMFAPLDFLNAIVYPSISKPIEELWDNIVVHDVENAKDNGLRGIYKLVNSEDFNREKYGDYQYIEINQDMLNKLLEGKYKTFEELKKNQIRLRETVDKYEYQEGLLYTILYYKKIDDNLDKPMTYIETIFIN
ncbi:hypothetical protein HYN56_21080 [Flavobacterium crocinum]|uniref:Uncharacterized protein n=1 Tax=Flavobacterium crocinum TaxID=2183896 RepID=A0A2S1YR91_9FLAO|nr:hypothetical protein [Flavobacterium crocinum]AWK06586.1 hypothetical protein HYN56_21080 [Flavobacterium crocinum]